MVWKKANVNFISNEEICHLFPLNMCKKKKKCYIHDLLDVINNDVCHLFPLNMCKK